MLEDDAAGAGHVQHGAGGVGSFAGDDDGGGRLADVVVDQLQQLVQVVRVAGRDVEQEHPGGPRVVVDPAGACGRDVGAVSGRSVDGGDGGREDLRGRRGTGGSGRVVGDPLVHGDGLLRDADAVELDLARPRVDGQLSGEVPGEVAAVGGVAADGEGGELLTVEQPGLPRVAGADGHQERVGRFDVPGVGAEVLDVDVRADVPVGLVGAADPGGGQRGRRAQVQGELAGAELDGRQRRHRPTAGAHGVGEPAERLVGELHGRGCSGAGGGHGHLDGGELGCGSGDRATRPAVAELSTAARLDGHEQRPGQQHSPAGETGEDPRGAEDGVVGLVDLVDLGRRRTPPAPWALRSAAARPPALRSPGRPAARSRPAGRPAAARRSARRASRACPRAAAACPAGRWALPGCRGC